MKFPELILLLIHYVTEVDRAKISNILQCYGPYQAWGNHKSKQRVYRIIATGSRDPRIDCFAKVGVHLTSKTKFSNRLTSSCDPTISMRCLLTKLLWSCCQAFTDAFLNMNFNMARVSGTIAGISPVMRLQEPESNKKKSLEQVTRPGNDRTRVR